MATRTQSRTSNRTSNSNEGNRNSSDERSETQNRSRSRSQRSSGRDTQEERSAFSWGNGKSGAIVGATLAGMAIGIAANYGRKLVMQGMEATVGDWDAILATEHDAALAIFDKMLATDESQTFKRKMLLMKLTHALDKHAHQEEMVVYPALREAGVRVEADQLEVEHGEVKTFLYELQQMGADSPTWLERVREFRSLISRHAHMEEEQVFPNFKQGLSAEQNARVTKLVNRDGFWMA
jgi:hemerythrin superfamily protein